MRKMKDSGVAWIGEIPEEWTVAPLKHLVNITMGQSPDSADVSDDGEIPFMQGNADFGTQYPSPHLYCDNAKKMCDAGDILLSVRAPVGALNLADRTYGIGRGLCAIQARDLHRDFLYFALMTLGGAFDYLSNGSTFDAITTSDLKNIQISVPPRDEQTKISETLQEKFSEIGNAINEMRRLIDKLALYKQSLITETVTKGLHPEAARKDSGDPLVGEIPASWKFISLKYLLASGRDSMRVGPFGSQLKGQDFQEEGVPVFTQKTVLDNDFFHGDTFISQEKYEQLKSFAVEAGDILITTRGSIGKIAVAPPDVTCGILHPCVIRFRTDKSKVMDEFLKYVFNETDLLRQQLLLKSNATTIDVVYSYALKCVSLAVPPLEEQREIVSYLANKCAAIDADIARRRKLIERLSAYRRSLIYEVVTGKREVV